MAEEETEAQGVEVSGAAGIRMWEMESQSPTHAAVPPDGQRRPFALQHSSLGTQSTERQRGRGLSPASLWPLVLVRTVSPRPQLPGLALNPGASRQAAGQGGPRLDLELDFHRKQAEAARACPRGGLECPVSPLSSVRRRRAWGGREDPMQ